MKASLHLWCYDLRENAKGVCFGFGFFRRKGKSWRRDQPPPRLRWVDWVPLDAPRAADIQLARACLESFPISSRAFCFWRVLRRAYSGPSTCFFVYFFVSLFIYFFACFFVCLFLSFWSVKETKLCFGSKRRRNETRASNESEKLIQGILLHADPSLVSRGGGDERRRCPHTTQQPMCVDEQRDGDVAI